MEKKVTFSVIIPFKGTEKYLPRLLDSIPYEDDIQVIVVENSDYPRSRESLGLTRDCVLLSAAESRFAGGARNVGLEAAEGEWVIFADSDDFFDEGAFDVFRSYANLPFDLVLFASRSVMCDSLEPADRSERFNRIAGFFLTGALPVHYVKYRIPVVWAKMFRRQLIEDNGIRFDETMVSNDRMFALKSDFHSASYNVDGRSVYVVTKREGNLSSMSNEEVLRIRFESAMKTNQFLRENGLKRCQATYLGLFKRAFKISPRLCLSMYRESVKNGYAPFCDIANILRRMRLVRRPVILW